MATQTPAQGPRPAQTGPSEPAAGANLGPGLEMPSTPASLGLPPGPPPPVVIAAPPSFGRQMAQLIIIPAVIVLAAVGMALLFGRLAGAADTVESQLERLRQAPLYKDRGLAAYNIATMIPSIKEPQKRRDLSKALTDILNQKSTPEEDPLQRYLLTAIGRLGQEGGLETVMARLNAPRPMLRLGAVLGVLSWPNAEEARAAVPQIIPLLEDQDPEVATVAAVALGTLGKPGDAGLIPALQAAEATERRGYRERSWNAAVALARLGDPRGSQTVAEQLLDRAALSRLPESEDDAGAGRLMPAAMQDHVILSALGAAEAMTDPSVWAKIKDLADRDPNRLVQSDARQLLLDRQKRAVRAAGSRTEESSPHETPAR